MSIIHTENQSNTGFIDLPEQVIKMSRDIKKATSTMGKDEARFLVDSYYQMQENRIRAAGQIRSITDGEEPHQTLTWLFEQNKTLESQLKGALNVFVNSDSVGEWMTSIVGIGPVIAAGMLAHIDIEKAPTAGHIWNFAGLNPNQKWGKGQRRPWNAQLKTLCWKLGESFVKVQNNEADVYGTLYAERKELLWQKNINGELSHNAVQALEAKKIGKDTTAYKFYSGLIKRDYVMEKIQSGDSFPPSIPKTALGEKVDTQMLPPAHINARAKRYAVKMFISHLQEVWYTMHYGKAPSSPYAIAILEHAHKVEVPNFDASDWIK